jgi:hypothetical protein
LMQDSNDDQAIDANEEPDQAVINVVSSETTADSETDEKGKA